MIAYLIPFVGGALSLLAFVLWGARRYEAGFQDGLRGRRETREEAKTR